MRLPFVLLFLSSSCLGQQFIKGGLSLAHTTAEPPNGAVRKLSSGFTFGFLFNRQLNDRASFRPEIAFVQKGERNTSSTEELKVRLNYIEVPLLFGWSLMTAPHPVMLLIEGGPSFGYGVGGNYKVISPGNSRSGAIKFGDKPSGANTNDVYLDNALDIGMQVGLAVTVRKHLLFDVRYGSGLTSFIDPPNPLPAGTMHSDFLTFNRTIQLTVGWSRQARTPDGY